MGSGREVVSIAASKHSNALIVTAPQDIMQSLQSVIEITATAFASHAATALPERFANT